MKFLLQPEAFIHQPLQPRPVENIVGKLFIRKHVQGGATRIRGHLRSLFHFSIWLGTCCSARLNVITPLFFFFLWIWILIWCLGLAPPAIVAPSTHESSCPWPYTFVTRKTKA